MKKAKGIFCPLFFAGLFSQLHVSLVGSIAISELVMFLIAPILFFQNYTILRRDNVVTFLNLTFLAIIGCMIASVANQTAIPLVLRGIAAPYGLWSSVIVLYILLRRNPKDFKWYLLGAYISFVLCTFIFQGAYERSTFEGRADTVADGIMSGSIYWIGRLNGFVLWPIQGLYMYCPSAYAIIAPFAFAIWALLSTESGRSSALMALIPSFAFAYVRKSAKRMLALQKHVGIILLVLVTTVFVFKSAYTFTASRGMLGEKAQIKYEKQVKGKKDILSILMGGRAEVFMGLYACAHSPIVGYGPWAVDRYGLTSEFFQKYGSEEAYKEFIISEASLEERGRVMLLQAHSAIVGWWLWYGILGLPVWFYAVYLICSIVRHHLSSTPWLFGYIVCALPSSAWNMFFSPFGNRLGWAFFFAMMLLIRAMSLECKEMRRRSPYFSQSTWYAHGVF